MFLVGLWASVSFIYNLFYAEHTFTAWFKKNLASINRSKSRWHSNVETKEGNSPFHVLFFLSSLSNIHSERLILKCYITAIFLLSLRCIVKACLVNVLPCIEVNKEACYTYVLWTETSVLLGETTNKAPLTTINPFSLNIHSELQFSSRRGKTLSISFNILLKLMWASFFFMCLASCSISFDVGEV